MKAKTIFFTLLISSLVLISCGEEPAELDPSLHDTGSGTVLPPDAGDFSALLNGSEFVPYSLTAVAATDGTNETITIAASKEITAGSGTYEAITIRLPKTITGPGSYTLGSASTPYAAFYNLNADEENINSTESGSLIISSHNTTTNRIVGSFNFVTSPLTESSPVQTITEGLFDVTYIE